MSTVEELRDSAYTLERGNWPLAAERMRKAAAELDTLKTEVELLRLQVQSWKAEYDALKHEVERLREALERLRNGDFVGTPINQGCGAMMLIEETLAKEKV